MCGARFPNLRTLESLSLRVGAAPARGFAKVRHAVPMLSLANAFGPEEVADFVGRIRRFLKLSEDEPLVFTAEPKIWLQLASGQNVDELARRFEHLKSDNPDLFDGIRPYVSQGVERARLLVGPFRGPSDAEIFAGDLKTIGIDAYRFTNSQTDRIAPLVAE